MQLTKLGGNCIIVRVNQLLIIVQVVSRFSGIDETAFESIDSPCTDVKSSNDSLSF